MPDLDPCLFAFPTLWLNAWCLAQPDRPTAESIAELAGYAGCSPRLMTQILNEERQLQLRHAEGLIVGLGLGEDAARHVRAITTISRASPAEAARLVIQIREAQARALGIPWEAPEGHLEDRLPRAFSTAALGAALAALGPERAQASPLGPRIVLPLRPEQLQEARPERHAPIAPRLVELGSPMEPHPAAVWHGLMGWAREALTYAQSHRKYVSFVGAIDAQAELQLREIGRNQRARLVELSCRHAQAPASVVLGLLFEHDRLVTAPRSAPLGQRLYWRRPGELLLPQDEEDTDETPMSAPPPIPRPPSGDVQPLGYLDLPSCIFAWRKSRKARNKPCSDGYIARRTGLPKSSAQDLVRGRVRFGPQHVEPFARLFEVTDDPAQLEALQAMADLNRVRKDPAWVARIATAQRRAAAERGIRRPETEAWFVASRWYPRVIHAMASLEGFEPSTGWIGRGLHGRITWDAAEQALHALNTLDMLREGPDGRVYGVSPAQEGVHRKLGVEFEQLNDSLLGLLKSELVYFEDDLSLQGYVLALPDDALPDLQALLQRAEDEVWRVMDDAEQRRQRGQPMDRVVLVAWQQFPLLHRLSPRRRP